MAVPEERRSVEGRLSRIEQSLVRIEERQSAMREDREVWRRETERRLGELNNHFSTARGEIERDRQQFISSETYQARHDELASLVNQHSEKLEARIDGNQREVNQIVEKIEGKIAAHGREDSQWFDNLTTKLKVVEEWKAAMIGSQGEADRRSRSQFLILGLVLAFLQLTIQLLLHFGIR